jgi:hypothetical protein
MSISADKRTLDDVLERRGVEFIISGIRRLLHETEFGAIAKRAELIPWHLADILDRRP